MKSYYKFFLELDSGKEVEVKAYYVILNDGIGPYEFWGQKCYDRGNEFVEIESQEWDKTLYTQKENEEIESKITEEQLEKWTEEIKDEKDYTFPNENEY
jgi:hypothetical protein